MSTEEWAPVVRTLTHRVKVSPEDHTVTSRGKRFYVTRVILRYEGRGWDGEWTGPTVRLDVRSKRHAGEDFLFARELDAVPAWLGDIEARAQPMDP